MSKLYDIFSHLCVILSIMFLTFLMNFVNNHISMWQLALLCVCSMGQSILRWAMEKKENVQ